MAEGFVKTVHEKRYGFIRVDKKDYFFHKNDYNGYWSDLENDFKELKDGEKIEVTFDIGDSPKGPCAQNVRRKDWPN